MEARQANDRIAEKAERLRFVSGVPMLCECGDPDCRTVVMIRLEAYHASRNKDQSLTAPGHWVEESELPLSRSDDELRSA